MYVGSSSFKQWLHDYEAINGSITEDGEYYIIGTDPAGIPTVGYGINVEAHKSKFIAAGYPTEVGEKVPVDFVNALEDELINNMRSYVLSQTTELNLTEYQIDALVSRVYNCGGSGALGTRESAGGMNFSQTYKKYWNQETDDEYGKSESQDMYNNSLYTTYMQYPITSKGEVYPGLIRRRREEWLLFKTGYYKSIGVYWSNMSEKIVKNAVRIHKSLRERAEKGFLKYGLVGLTIPISNNTATIDCSSFVSQVLYDSGFVEEFKGHQKTKEFDYNPWGWQEVSIKDARAGDIVDYADHVEIIAENDPNSDKFRVYNCGGNKSIQAKGTEQLPESSMSGHLKALALKIYRPPQI